MTIYICTAGTSIATGPLSGAPQAPLTQRIATKIEALLARHGDDPVPFLHEISAETNGLARDNCGPSDTVVLLASDTDDGVTCAEAVARLVGNHLGAKVRVRRAHGLTVKAESSFRQKGIRNLIGIVHAEARSANEPVVFNATGGFKGVVPYLTLMGMFLGVPVHYVFESSDAVIRLPPLPVRFDLVRLGFAVEALRSLAGAPGGLMREPEFLRLLPGRGFNDDEVFQQLIEVSDGMVALSAAGELALTLVNELEPQLDRLMVRKALLSSPLMASEQVRSHLPKLSDPLFRARPANCETFPQAPGILVCKTVGGAAPRLYYEVRDGVVHVLELLSHKDHESFSDRSLTIDWERLREAPAEELASAASGAPLSTAARLAAFVDHVLGDEAIAELARERDSARADAEAARERADRLSRRLDSLGDALALSRRASLWAAEAFAGKTRKDAAATPYINHSMQVVALLEDAGVRDGAVLAAGWLHDAIEDDGATEAELADHFGYDVARLVSELTDDKSLSKDERKRLQILNAPAKSPLARLIALAEKIANLRDLAQSPPPDWDVSRRIAYFSWAKDVVDGFAKPVSPQEERLRARFDEALALKPQV